MILEKDENIETEIEHKNYLPLRQEDWARFIFIPFMIIGFYIFFTQNDYFSLLFTIPGFITFYNLIKRWIKIFKIKYYLTEKRLIIYNKDLNKIEYSFYFEDFPEMTLRENAYNYGFIIIGEPEELIEGSDTPFRFPMRSGLNTKDHEVVIDNIQNVRNIYNLILDKIKTAHNTS